MMICATIKATTYEQARLQMREMYREADMVELRLDYFTDLNFEKIKEIKDSLPIPVIFTLRDKTQGGLYQGDEESRLKEIRRFASLQPDYFDVEAHLSFKVVHELVYNYPEVKWILSNHFLDKTPDNLEEIYWEMKKKPAFFYKIAAQAKNSLDAMRMLDFLRQHPADDLLAISLGVEGQMTRILGPVFNVPFVYACIEDDKENEYGQLPVSILKNIYHHYDLSPKSLIFCLIGDPVEQSLGHLFHNEWFHANKIDGIYFKMKVGKTELDEWIKYAIKLNFSGASVTMPLKELMQNLLDEVDPIAEEIGAVNTLLFKKSRVKGYNTDCLGALNAIEEKIGSVRGKKIVVLGAGGAAKAIVYEACKRGGSVTILNRHVHKAKLLAQQFGCQAAELDSMNEIYQQGYDILINSTPSPAPIDSQFLLKTATIMDIISNPKETFFLKSALEKGCQVVYGYDMFVKQARAQHRIWDLIDYTNPSLDPF